MWSWLYTRNQEMVGYPQPGPWPRLRVFFNAKKCWIISKKDKEESVKQVFKDRTVNVTVQGQKHQDAVIGSREYLEEYVSEKVTN